MELRFCPEVCALCIRLVHTRPENLYAVPDGQVPERSVYAAAIAQDLRRGNQADSLYEMDGAAMRTKRAEPPQLQLLSD
jgi:hypothetical protein